MLTPINNLSNNTANRINFKSDINKLPLEKYISKDTKQIFIPASECLEAYNRGGLMLNFIDGKKEEKPPISKKSQEFVSNLLLYSDCDINGKTLNLVDAFRDFLTQNAVLKTTENRISTFTTAEGKTEEQEIERYILEDGTVVDKKIYDAPRNNNRAQYIRRKAGGWWDPAKIDIGDYEIYFFRGNNQTVTNIIDKNTNTVIAKRYKENGTITGVQKLDFHGLDKKPLVTSKIFTTTGTKEYVMPSNIINYFTEELISKYNLRFIRQLTAGQKEKYIKNLEK